MGKQLSLFLFLLLCLPILALPGACGHTQHQTFEVPVQRVSRTQQPSHLSTFARRGVWEPIRIKVYYGTLDITAPVKSKLMDAIKGSMNWFKNSLSVKPIQKPWKLGIKDCGDVVFTGPILTDSFDADFVLYVIADSVDNGLAGYATWCSSDAESNQPLTGVYYFNGLSHQDVSMEQIYATTIHEITHALVFSSDLYDFFRKSNGEKYKPTELFLEEIVRGRKMKKFLLPTVLEKARAGFSCSNLNGLELEADGDAGSVGVHWEKRVMYNDFMVADSDMYDVTYTDVTMGLFQDSGWYKVNYKYSNSQTWGYHKGCEFISEKCVQNGKTSFRSDFCTKKNTNSCDYLGLRKGYCDVMTHTTALPAPYQYFSEPKQGGSDAWLDYCPVVKPYSDGNCRDPATAKLVSKLNEAAGDTSRCLTGDYDKSKEWKHAGCYPVNCSGANAVLTIGTSTVTCPVSGGDVAVTGFKGTINCPPYSDLCRALPCVNNCHGFGYCEKSACVCQDGTSKCQQGFAGY